MIAYKWLRSDGTGPFTGFPWPLPVDGPGAWVDAGVAPCRSGIHACRAGDLPLWVAEALFEIELAGDIVEESTKVVASRGRLVRRVTRWSDAFRDTYTRHCAERAHALARSAEPPLTEWEPVIDDSLPDGPAALGFIAARIADEVSGTGAYRAERARQSAWLVDRLQLSH